MLDATALLIVCFLLILKHFVVDFMMQGPYQYLNKGTYGHPGGLLHAGLHGVTTAGILAILPVLSITDVVVLALVDAVIHYHVDWAKVNINKFYGWQPDNSKYYWWLLGLDQFMHQLTYFAILGYIVLR